MLLNHENLQDTLKIDSKSLLSSSIFVTFVLNVCLLVHHPVSNNIGKNWYRKKLPNSGLL